MDLVLASRIAAGMLLVFALSLYRRQIRGVISTLVTGKIPFHVAEQKRMSLSAQQESYAVPYLRLTPKELAQYDGTGPDKRILIAVLGHIYDVTSGASFYGPGSSYHAFAGRDASRGLAKQSFEQDVLTPVDMPLDPLLDLTKSEWSNLKDWEGLFAGKYVPCGELIR